MTASHLGEPGLWRDRQHTRDAVGGPAALAVDLFEQEQQAQAKAVQVPLRDEGGQAEGRQWAAVRGQDFRVQRRRSK